MKLNEKKCNLSTQMLNIPIAKSRIFSDAKNETVIPN